MRHAPCVSRRSGVSYPRLLYCVPQHYRLWERECCVTVRDPVQVARVVRMARCEPHVRFRVVPSFEGMEVQFSRYLIFKEQFLSHAHKYGSG